jgi:putative two-component system response regulator
VSAESAGASEGAPGRRSRRARILIVEDSDELRSVMARSLEQNGYLCVESPDAKGARARLAASRFTLALVDLKLSGESGLDLARDITRDYPHTPVVMVTSLDHPRFADAAFELGAYGYVVKPFSINELLINVANALRRRSMELENHRYRGHLERTVADRTAKLKQVLGRLERAAEETIHRLARAAEFRDLEWSAHIERMSRHCATLATHLGLGDGHVGLIALASKLHDIGKFAIPDSVLFKPGPLTREEFNEVKRHAEIGYRILSGSESEVLELAAQIAWTHHERWDGTGYPRGLVGDAIPLEGRIAAIADVFDAMTSRRDYKAALSVDKAAEEMANERGRHFDPDLLEVFLSSMGEAVGVLKAHPDAA